MFVHINIVRVAGGGQMNNCPVNQSYSIEGGHNLSFNYEYDVTRFNALVHGSIIMQNQLRAKQPETMFCWVGVMSLEWVVVVALFGAYYTYPRNVLSQIFQVHL